MLLRFVLRALLLGALLLPFQLLVGGVLETEPLPARDRLDAIVKSRADVLFFGDSVSTATRSDDQDKRPLDLFLEERLPGRRVGRVGGNAHFMDVHLAYLEYALASSYRPRIVVVPLNPRSFSPLWDKNPAFQHVKDRIRLRWGDSWGCGLARPVMGYRLYDRAPASEGEWLEVPAFIGTKNIGTLGQVLNGKGPLQLIPPLERFLSLCYLNPVTEGHRHLVALGRIAALCRQEGIPLLVYVTPVDMESGERWIGPAFREIVGNNLDVVRRSLSAHGVNLLDLSALLEAAAFAWKDFPNEHLAEDGRRRLAEAIASAIVSLAK